MVHRTDQELIEDHIGGDAHAFNELVDRHTREVYIFVRRFVRNAEDADDIVQDTFMKAWKHIKKYDSHHSFKTWLYRIARNTAIDALRKRRDIPLSSFTSDEGTNAILDTLPDEEPLPDELARRAQEKHVLDQVLENMQPLYREVLLLRYINDLPFDEIATILDRPFETVRSQHRRGLRMLRELLETRFQGGP